MGRALAASGRLARFKVANPERCRRVPSTARSSFAAEQGKLAAGAWRRRSGRVAKLALDLEQLVGEMKTKDV